jgi:trk system potassium uptake protein TrkA
MHTIIIGCGRIGSQLARELSDSGMDVAVIDRDSARLNSLGSGFNGQRIKGIEFDTDILVQAGIEKADLILCVTPDDNVNITVSMVAMRLFNVPRVIARVCSQDKKYVYDKLNIETINPTQLGVDLLISRIGEAKP